MEPKDKEKPKARLENLDVFEVSFVPKAANKRTYLMYKADTGTTEPVDTTIDDGTNSIIPEEVIVMSEAITKALEGELQDVEKIDATMKDANVSEGGIEALKAVMKILVAYKEDLPDAEQIPVLLGYPLPDPVEVEKIVEKIVEVEKKVTEKTDEEKKAEVLKGVTDETARAEITKLYADQEALKAEQAELKATVEAAEEAKEVKDCVEKAKAEYPNLPAKAEDIGPAMRAIKKSASDEQYDLVERMFKAANEAIEKSKEPIGGPGGTNEAGTTYADLQAKAEEMVAKGEYETAPAAVAALMRKDPSQWDKYNQDA